MPNNEINIRDDFVESQKADRTSLSSIAKYSIAILSALVVLFPSTYTFIHPPHKHDFILAIVFFAAIAAFVINCRVIIDTEFVGTRTIKRKLYKTSALGSLLTIITLLFLFAYIGINVYEDRTSNPKILDLQISPLEKLVVNSTIQFSGVARDQDSDILIWNWKLNKNNESSSKNKNCNLNFNNVEPNLRRVYWTPDCSGTYTISVDVSDGNRKSNKEVIRFLINGNDEQNINFKDEKEKNKENNIKRKSIR